MYSTNGKLRNNMVAERLIFHYPDEWYELFIYERGGGVGLVIHSCERAVDYGGAYFMYSRCINCGRDTPKDLLSFISLNPLHQVTNPLSPDNRSKIG